ncbi:Hypothetical predicted protein [Podarcis lilfordi]|uniref:Uncharacterized protein n=1 Tax=Podarcis lilfordi TaxID=74358 RepID=A0AA35KMI5_9SAUR|nr:Hypothetical predicted protein [Podarcis lilfordi]
MRGETGHCDSILMPPAARRETGHCDFQGHCDLLLRLLSRRGEPGFCDLVLAYFVRRKETARYQE